jgi:hypothetical protein
MCCVVELLKLIYGAYLTYRSAKEWLNEISSTSGVD